MIRAVFIFPSLLALASCAGDPFGAKPAQAWPTPTQVARGHIDFDWLLSGDRAVAPLQVFNDAASTWLQFARGQNLPAIFAVVQGQEAVVPYVWQEPYAVLAGRWPEIVLRGGRLTARARYGAELAGLPAPVRQAVEPDAVVPPGSAQKPQYASALAAAGPVAASAMQAPATTRAPASPALSAVTFGASPQDVNMRRALARWARLAGWTFAPQHWAVDADIPLAGSAELGADFKLAVNRLLESTELSDRPAHPCFYSNHVLRVVPLTEPCLRPAASERSS